MSMKCRWNDSPVVQWRESVSADMTDSCSGAVSHILQNICSHYYIILKIGMDFMYFVLFYLILLFSFNMHQSYPIYDTHIGYFNQCKNMQ